MYASPLYFRQLHTDARTVNYTNTVLVRRNNRHWWLGYVQDLDGDRFLIDFDASSLRRRWIPSRHVWPHPLLPRAVPCPRGLSIHVAVRETPELPMVFRPGTITHEVADLFHGVRLEGGDPTSPALIVDQCQFVSTLPPRHSKRSFASGNTTFVYRKHVVNFEQAGLLRDVALLPKFAGRTCRITLGAGDTVCDASCQFARSFAVGSGESTFHCTGLHLPSMPHDIRAIYTFNVGCRMFARVDTGTVTFVCAEVHGNAAGRSMFWTEEALREACQDCVAAQQPRLSPSISSEHGAMDNFQSDEEEAHINELPYTILADILLQGDMFTQQRLDRVCTMWRLLLEDYAMARERLRVLDISWLLAEKPVDEEFNVECHYQTYQLVTKLDRSLTVLTPILALVDTAGCFDPTKKPDGRDAAGQAHCIRRHEFFDRMQLIRHSLKAQNHRVPLIIMQNSGDRPELNVVLLDIGPVGEETDQYECRALRQWMGACRQLLLVNYTAALPTGWHRSLLDKLFCYGAGDRTWLEDGHRAEEGEYERGAHLPISIPFLRFHCTENAAEQCRRFIASVNDHCPAVRQQMIEKVTGVLARWVQTLAYPNQWTGIRMFLNLFSSIGPDGSPQSWDNADLRQLNVAMLSRLAMHILDEYFKD
ncbi:uncharacterized protein LOC129601179 [Paramacrobiotus metropolitanus]|uniref:uncharacterized protein LOC129601179 n=1 Tax=Paramacrobiotus metropolitanus TaxID=2943436 RepID=UPI00244600C9|nr:uncharacterized protein LOC129601179 [Paramacrobiotus metropolitanus]